MSVRIRMKKMGRRHRPYYRICAVDSRAPRDGRVIEELGTYDPMVKETDARCSLNGERVQYWLGVGAQPSDKVKVLIKKYGSEGTHVAERQAALDRLAAPKAIPDLGEPAYKPEPPRAPAPPPAPEPAAKEKPAPAEPAQVETPEPAAPAETAEATEPAEPAAEAAPPEPPEPAEPPAETAEVPAEPAEQPSTAQQEEGQATTEDSAPEQESTEPEKKGE